MHGKPSAKMPSKIIARGLFSPLTKQIEATRKELRSAVRVRYAKEIKDASFLRRARLEIKIEREVQAELDTLFPLGALYSIPQRHFRA